MPKLTKRKVRTSRISGTKKLVFVGIVVLLSLGCVEIGARLIEIIHHRVGRDENPFVDTTNPVRVFKSALQNGSEVYQRTEHHHRISPGQTFSLPKTQNTFRIFMLGGSAATGWPHYDFTITKLLAQKLRTLLPRNNIEVLNTAGGTYASHRVRVVYDEVIEYEPDLILLYSGNNEFLENFVFRAATLPRPWRHSALLRITSIGLRGILDRSSRPTFDVENYSHADQASNRLSYAFGRASKYRQDPQQFQYVLAHYRYNIESMVADCKKRGVPVMLLNVPVNLKDWIPNVSVHRSDITPIELAQWTTHFRDGVLALERDDYFNAVISLARAIGIDDEYAEAHFLLGQAQQQLGQTAEAKASYHKALIRDAHPFRALPEFQRILEDIATTYHIRLIDIVALLEQQAGDGIIGSDVMLDYVHLTAKSQEAIAHEILQAIDRAELLPGRKAMAIDETRIDVPTEFEQIGSELYLIRSYTELYGQFLVMRQYDKIDRIHPHYLKILRQASKGEENAKTLAMYQRMTSVAERIKRVVDPYRKLLRAEKLGVLEAEFTKVEAQRIFENYVQMIWDLEAQQISPEEFSKYVPKFTYGDSSTQIGQQ